MNAFICNAIEAHQAGHTYNVTHIHANGLLSRAWVKACAPKQWVGENIVERTDGLFEVYRKGTLQAVAETLDSAKAHDAQLRT